MMVQQWRGMLGDPFNDPFGMSLGRSTSDLFKRPRGGGGRRPPPKPEEAEPEQIPDDGTVEEEAPEEKTKDKVVLKNPVWEIEKVGFNEETDISVEAELPEAHAHKTRVEFELFARTPDGPEAIAKVEGTVEAGKAKARIPVYMPRFMDEFGNLLRKVEYFFTAKHSQSDLLKDDGNTKEIEEMADPLLESHILQDVTFATGKSFPSPGQAAALKALVAGIREWKQKHQDGKLAVFGHADAVGLEQPNKNLSERRATAVQAFLVKDAAAWETLYNEDKWGLASTQDMLKHLGHDPGSIDGKDGPKTQAAVKAFQSAQGLPATGQSDAATRKGLYAQFMGTHNSESLRAKDFDVIDGKAHSGCSEFNRVEDSAGDCAANRRVAVFLLKSTKNFPIQYPCKHGDIAPCKRQVGRKGERRTKGFGCLFYDKLVKEVAGATKPAKVEGRALFQKHDPHPFGYDEHGQVDAEDQNGSPVDCKGDPELDFLSVETGKKGLVELHYEKMEGKDIHLALKDSSLGDVKILDPSSMPLIVEIHAKKGATFSKTTLEARAGSAEGPLLAELGIVILSQLTFKATYIRVEDPTNAATKLTTSLTVSELNKEMNRLYKSGAADWKIIGDDKITAIEYDEIRNGSLDLEPGIKSKELKKIIAKCSKTETNIIHVHNLRWSYFLAKPASAADKVLTLKNYGGSLDYIGENTYSIEDGAGNSVAISVSSVDKAKCQIHLSAPIGVDFKLEDSPALIWPLGGLSGNPTLVSDVGSTKDLIIYAAHELGHTLAGFFDLVEKENIMFGGPSTGEGLRHRPIPKYYYPDEDEEQWKSMRGIK